MSTKPRDKQLLITMFLGTPTPTNSRKNDGNTPMTRKRRRELEAEAGKDFTGADPAEMETPTHAGKRAKRSSKVTPKPASGGKGKTRFQERDAGSDEEGKRAGPSKPPTHRAVRAARKAGNLLTPESEGMLRGEPPEDSAVSSLKTPLAALKLRTRRTSTESPLPRNTRRDLRSSNVGLPTPVPSSRSVSKSKANNPSKVLVRTTPEPPPIILSSSPLSSLTDLPDVPNSPRYPQAPSQNSSPIFKVPALPIHTPHRKRVELNPPQHSTTAVDSDEGLVPTSQSQDLKPFFVSPPRPGGTALLKDTTPKSLRRSQGYTKQPPKPLPSVLATIQAREYTQTQESDVVATSQIEETELRIPRSARVGPSRALAFSSPPDKLDNPAPSQPPSSERTGVLKTPVKTTNLARDGKVHITSPVSELLYSPMRSSPTRRDGGSPPTSSLPPSSIPPSTDPHRSSRDDTALDFVQYQTTPTKRRSSIDSPRKDIRLFESQATLSPTWSQPRSFERWRLRDLLAESQHGLNDGKAGLEAEAEGREPGEGLGTDAEESEELEKAAMMASSITEAESQDLAEWFSRVHPELKFGGKAPQYKSSTSSFKSGKSGPDSAENGSGSRVEQVGIIVIDDTPPSSQNSKKSDPDPITNRIDNVGVVPPVKTPTESQSQSGSSRKAGDESQGGLGESALRFSQPTLDPLRAFLDMFEGASSMPQDSQSVIDIDD